MNKGMEPNMPSLPLNACRNPSCPALVRSGFCPECQRSRPVYVPPPKPAFERHGGTRHERGYGYQWVKQRTAHLKREPNCRLCGQPGTQVDHIRPKSAGGDESDRNMQTLCKKCHQKKSAKEGRSSRT